MVRRAFCDDRGSVSLEHTVLVCCIGVACVAATTELGGEINGGARYAFCEIQHLTDPDAECVAATEPQRGTRNPLIGYRDYAALTDDQIEKTRKLALADSSDRLSATEIAEAVVMGMNDDQNPFASRDEEHHLAAIQGAVVVDDATSSAAILGVPSANGLSLPAGVAQTEITNAESASAAGLSSDNSSTSSATVDHEDGAPENVTPLPRARRQAQEFRMPNGDIVRLVHEPLDDHDCVATPGTFGGYACMPTRECGLMTMCAEELLSDWYLWRDGVVRCAAYGTEAACKSFEQRFNEGAWALFNGESKVIEGRFEEWPLELARGLINGVGRLGATAALLPQLARNDIEQSIAKHGGLGPAIAHGFLNTPRTIMALAMAPYWMSKDVTDACAFGSAEECGDLIGFEGPLIAVEMGIEGVLLRRGLNWAARSANPNPTGSVPRSQRSFRSSRQPAGSSNTSPWWRFVRWVQGAVDEYKEYRTVKRIASMAPVKPPSHPRHARTVSRRIGEISSILRSAGFVVRETTVPFQGSEWQALEIVSGPKEFDRYRKAGQAPVYYVPSWQPEDLRQVAPTSARWISDDGHLIVHEHSVANFVIGDFSSLPHEYRHGMADRDFANGPTEYPNGAMISAPDGGTNFPRDEFGDGLHITNYGQVFHADEIYVTYKEARSRYARVRRAIRRGPHPIAGRQRRVLHSELREARREAELTNAMARVLDRRLGFTEGVFTSEVSVSEIGGEWILSEPGPGQTRRPFARVFQDARGEWVLATLTPEGSLNVRLGPETPLTDTLVDRVRFYTEALQDSTRRYAANSQRLLDEIKEATRDLALSGRPSSRRTPGRAPETRLPPEMTATLETPRARGRVPRDQLPLWMSLLPRQRVDVVHQHRGGRGRAADIHGPTELSVSEAIRLAGDDRTTNLQIVGVASRGRPTTIPDHITVTPEAADMFDQSSDREVLSAVITYRSGKQARVVGNREMVVEALSDQDAIHLGLDRSSSIPSVHDVGPELRYSGALDEAWSDYRNQLGDGVAVDGSKTDLPGQVVHHGTIRAFAASVQEGPRNVAVNRDYGGRGLYLLTDADQLTAMNHASLARQRYQRGETHGIAPSAGIQHTSPEEPVVLSGRFREDLAGVRVGRFTVTDTVSEPDLERGLLPTGWADEPSLFMEFMESEFDVLDITFYSGMLPMDYQRMFVVQERAGSDVIEWLGEQGLR